MPCMRALIMQAMKCMEWRCIDINKPGGIRYGGGKVRYDCEGTAADTTTLP